MEKQRIENLIEKMQNSDSVSEIRMARNEINQILCSLDKTNILKHFLLWQDLAEQYIVDSSQGNSIPFRETDLRDILEIVPRIISNNEK